MRAVAAGCALACAVVGLAQASSSSLPPPAFTVKRYATALSAAGARAALGADCQVRVADLFHGTAPRVLKRVGDCATDAFESDVNGLWLGRTSLAEETILSPSPHGDTYRLWTGAATGPLHATGSEWGWTDSDVPAGYGCAWAVASGGGVVALERIPNTLALDQGLAKKPTCPAGATSTVNFKGASPAQLKVNGSWEVLATDGKRVLLAALDPSGHRTGALALYQINGKQLATPHVDPAAVKTASQTWLLPQGVVLIWKKGLTGPGWMVRGLGAFGAATVGEGRVIYLKGRTVRVRRVRGGPDRTLLRLPTLQAYLGAGSFGLAVATTNDANTKSSVYRIPWSTIDQTLPQ